MELELDQPAVELTTGERLQQFAAVWRGEATLAGDAAPVGEVRAGNLVVQGVLSGIARHVMRPVPATGAAARRLRARSFRAAALSELLARRVAERLGLSCLLRAGGMFLLAGPASAGWQDALHSLQREFDVWLFQHLQPAGELECHLAGALCGGQQLPSKELEEQLRQRRLQPLEGALRIGLRWNGRAFVLPASPDTGRCCGCDAVGSVQPLGEEILCERCAADSELGARLPGQERAWLCPESEADLPGPGLGLKFSPAVPLGGTGAEELRLDAAHWPLLRRFPVADGRPLGFDELAQRAANGNQLLGYVRADVDQTGRAFAAHEGDPARTVALSRLLDGFFSGHLWPLLEGDFPLAFPVFGGGDNLLLIGPWQRLLDLVLRVQQDFAALVGDRLTLSAGLTLSPAHAHLRAATEQAAEAAREAKRAGGNRLHTLGVVMEWKRAASLVTTARLLADWLQRRAISPAWLKRVAKLCASSRNGNFQWRPLLEAAIRDPRVKHPLAKGWAARLTSDAEDSDRPWMEFLARYASLAAGT